MSDVNVAYTQDLLTACSLSVTLFLSPLIMGNDLMSYRASIGSFYVKVYSFLRIKEKRYFIPFAILLSLSILLSNTDLFAYFYFISLRLVLSGDIELNPGPPQDTGFQFCCINSRSLLSHDDKFSSLQSFVDSNDYSIIGITETWFNSNIPDSSLTLNSYNVFRRDRVGSRGGGVAFYI